jgi:hypothetical protein
MPLSLKKLVSERSFFRSGMVSAPDLIRARSPLLADRVALSTVSGIELVSRKVFEAIALYASHGIWS